jgi:hypothetical protein
VHYFDRVSKVRFSTFRSLPLSWIHYDRNERLAVMDSGGNYNDDNGWMFTQQLPAVIPVPRVPTVIPRLRRIAVPYWSLIVLAIVGSVAAGAVTATFWPWEYHSKTAGAAALQRHGDSVATSGSVADNALATEEVTKIDLSPVRLKPASLSPGGLNTANLSPANLTTTNPNASKPITVKPAEAEPPAQPPAQVAQDPCQSNPSKPQIVMNLQRTTLRSDEPASLGLTVDGAAEGAHLIICGFAAKSVFSVGRAVDENTWSVPASMIADATIMPPRGFAGQMDLAVTLMNTDRSPADRKTVRLQWLPEAQPAPRRDFANLDSLLNYGVHLKAAGNLADARQIFSRAAQGGDPRGAFMLAETYDPISLAKHQLLPRDSDPELARIWYRKASDLGSLDAPGRLERLTNW